MPAALVIMLSVSFVALTQFSPLIYKKKKKIPCLSPPLGGVAHLALHHLDAVLPGNGRILRLLDEVPEHSQHNAGHLLLDTLTQDVCQGGDHTVPGREQ